MCISNLKEMIRICFISNISIFDLVPSFVSSF